MIAGSSDFQGALGGIMSFDIFEINWEIDR
jgi:hypothetical protein